MYLEAAGRSVSLSDTVGFIRNLPHGLVDAFAATLQEAVDADLLLHVVDAANPHHLEQMREVARVLDEIGASAVPQVLVFNKLDAMEPERTPLQLQDHLEIDGIAHERLFVSARTGAGLPALRQHLALRARGDRAPGATPDEALENAEAAARLGTIGT